MAYERKTKDGEVKIATTIYLPKSIDDFAKRIAKKRGVSKSASIVQTVTESYNPMPR